ncbi:response regulator transcription factor [Streptomyces sp. NBC_00876]|uniref:response regulator transcription factor n=1 Tax=Streptomyces sp. NBC_00876 TaxID=2975853 RepID=UPI0038658805|nr:response regulator transcription factor [Streptomyces sp. NBC_00876]
MQTTPDPSPPCPAHGTPPASGTEPGATSRGHVLVVDDDPTVAEVVTGYLTGAGYDVTRAANGPDALDQYAARRPDLAVLDLMLPGMDGFEVCRRMRAHGPVPVIMLTARGDEDDRILGLETGADDYVTKPFSPRELVLRVDSVLRRVGASAAPAGRSALLEGAGLVLDPVARHATWEGSALALTLREFDLLAFFLRHPGRVFTREELMSEVWGWDFGDLSTVTVHVRRLRGKVETDPARPELIRTVWGVGYRLDLPPGRTANTATASTATASTATTNTATTNTATTNTATAGTLAAGTGTGTGNGTGTGTPS